MIAPSRTLVALVPVAVAFAASGCASAPHAVRFEVEHVSHPTVGEPFEPQQGTEYALNQAQAIASWRSPGGAYVETGLGYNLKGKNGGGIRGPAFMGSVRAGYEWRIRN